MSGTYSDATVIFKVSDRNLQSLISFNPYLKVAKLSELLAAVVEFASKRFNLLVNNLMRSHVSTLRESLAALIAIVRALPGVTTFMGLCWSLASTSTAMK